MNFLFSLLFVPHVYLSLFICVSLLSFMHFSFYLLRSPLCVLFPQTEGNNLVLGEARQSLKLINESPLTLSFGIRLMKLQRGFETEVNRLKQFLNYSVNYPCNFAGVLNVFSLLSYFSFLASCIQFTLLPWLLWQSFHFRQFCQKTIDLFFVSDLIHT